MAARLIAELVLGIALLLAILFAVYRFAGGGRTGTAPELDVSRTPSEWFTDSRTTAAGNTEVCIVRVETRTGLVRERRVLRTLDNDAPGYGKALDEALDEAHEAMRVANVHLRRR